MDDGITYFEFMSLGFAGSNWRQVKYPDLKKDDEVLFVSPANPKNKITKYTDIVDNCKMMKVENIDDAYIFFVGGKRIRKSKDEKRLWMRKVVSADGTSRA
jgi:hypothetical protein